MECSLDLNFWALIVSVFSLIAASVGCFLSAHFFRSNKKAEFFNLVYECVKPLSVFIYDALLIRDKFKFRDTDEIEKAERELYSNFESLYSYGVGYKLPYLVQFSTLNCGNSQTIGNGANDARKYEYLPNSMCFLYVLSIYQDKYIEYRKCHKSGEIAENDHDYEVLGYYVQVFRWLLKLQSEITLPILFKRFVRKKTFERYYNQLFFANNIKEFDLIRQEINDYEKNNKKSIKSYCKERNK